MASCGSSPLGRRNLFWATQPGACGDTAVCGSDCGHPGLEPLTDSAGAVTLSTDNWLQGLVINMLMTDGRRPDQACGYAPGGQGGHWSASYMSADTGLGTLLRTATTVGRVQQLTALITSYAQSTMQRLVTRGVAVDVSVDGSYLGEGKYQLDIIIVGLHNTVTRVGLSGARLANGWVWEGNT